MKGSWTVGLALLAGAALPASAEERRLPFLSDGIEPCGANAFRLPGSDGCVRLGGSLAAQTVLRSGRRAGAGQGSPWASASRADARVTADMRVPTEFGPLRVYGSLRSRRGL